MQDPVFRTSQPKSPTPGDIDVDPRHPRIMVETAFLAKSITIESLTIENIKCFDDTKIDFKNENTVLIGINGRGKTTVLQLLALGLAKAKRPIINTEWRGATRDKTKKAGFTIDLQTENKTVNLAFSPGFSPAMTAMAATLS